MEEALSDFEQAIMLEESYIPAIINKAATFSQNMKYTEAIAILDDIIDNASRNGIAYLNRGLVRELSGDLKGACEDWHKAISYGIAEAENFIKECK
jgi:tetratricopeptide (TPR) repeat protein